MTRTPMQEGERGREKERVDITIEYRPLRSNERTMKRMASDAFRFENSRLGLKVRPEKPRG